MKSHLFIAAAVLAAASCNQYGGRPDSKDKTIFQTSQSWNEYIDNQADAVMVYGVGGNPTDRARARSVESRLSSWRERGYTAHFMTGIAWGEYKDYFTGEWDGKWHLDEGQVNVKGDTLWHGHLVPYIVPSENYLEYFKERHIKRVIDAGVDAIFLEEPEFWAEAGYSESFKREWEDYYGTPWPLASSIFLQTQGFFPITKTYKSLDNPPVPTALVFPPNIYNPLILILSINTPNL